jgi:hypothetical protein
MRAIGCYFPTLKDQALGNDASCPPLGRNAAGSKTSDILPPLGTIDPDRGCDLPPAGLQTGMAGPILCALLITSGATGQRRDRYKRRVIDGHEVSIIMDGTTCGLPWSAPAISA